jgi:hypothetical protein
MDESFKGVSKDETTFLFFPTSPIGQLSAV